MRRPLPHAGSSAYQALVAMIRNPTRDFYLSIENADQATGDDWPDAPMPHRDDPVSQRWACVWLSVCALIIAASLAYLATQARF